MRRALLFAAAALVLSAGVASAFDAVGTIKKVDAEKAVLYIHAGGQDRTLKIDKDVKVLGTDGKPLADGLKAKQLKDGAEVTITVEREGDTPVVKAIRLGAVARGNDTPTGGKSAAG